MIVSLETVGRNSGAVFSFPANTTEVDAGVGRNSSHSDGRSKSPHQTWDFLFLKHVAKSP